MPTTHTRLMRCAGALALVTVLAAPAAAGPPFICHPFELGTRTSLPWGTGPGWNTPDPRYDLDRLTSDVTRLLTPDVPVTARMETLRRATIYAARDRRVAASLLDALVARASTPAADALALFDAGFLVEAYRQASNVYKWDMLSSRERERWTLREAPTAVDGVQLMDRAITRASAEAPAMRQARKLVDR
jgi:hypothetical protein